MYYSLQKSEIDRPISFSIALKNLKEFTKKTNRSNGLKIKLGRQVLSEQIVKQTIKSLTNNRNYVHENGYYLSTKIGSLATLCNVTPRTIRNQLNGLQQVNFLNYKREQRGIKIYINPDALIPPSVRKNLHPLDKELTCSKEENTIKPVDKLITPQESIAYSFSKNIEEGAMASCQNLHNSKRLAMPFNYQTIQFFNKSMELLYPNLILSDDRELKLKHLIQKDVLNDGFKDPYDTYNFNVRALQKAKTWFERRQKFKIPEPEYYFKNNDKELFTFSKAKEWVRIEYLEKSKNDYLQGRITSGSIAKLLIQTASSFDFSNSSQMILRNAF